MDFFVRVELRGKKITQITKKAEIRKNYNKCLKKNKKNTMYCSIQKKKKRFQLGVVGSVSFPKHFNFNILGMFAIRKAITFSTSMTLYISVQLLSASISLYIWSTSTKANTYICPAYV